MTSPRQRLRAMLRSGETIVGPCCIDPLTARLVERIGFPLAYLGGCITGLSLAISEPLLSLRDQVEMARRIAQVVDIPLIVDGDAGFGEPVHAMHAVREFEKAGVAGIHIEDQVYPKRAHYPALERVTSREEFYTKIQCALEARRDPDFLVIARSDAHRAVGGSMEELVQRVRDLKNMGVEVIFPLLVTREEKQAFLDMYGPPDCALMALNYPNDTPVDELAAMGFRIVVFHHAGFIAAMGTILDMYRGLKETGIAKVEDKARWFAVWQELEDAVGRQHYREIEKKTTEHDSKISGKLTT